MTTSRISLLNCYCNSSHFCSLLYFYVVLNLMVFSFLPIYSFLLRISNQRRSESCIKLFVNSLVTVLECGTVGFVCIPISRCYGYDMSYSVRRVPKLHSCLIILHLKRWGERQWTDLWTFAKTWGDSLEKNAMSPPFLDFYVLSRWLIDIALQVNRVCKSQLISMEFNMIM